MNLVEYVTLDEQHTLSAGDVQSLNADLSARSYTDIPEEYRDRMADYLIAVLNMQSVEPKFIPRIQQLLKDLQRAK